MSTTEDTTRPDVWMHVDDHNGGLWMPEPDWQAWINERRDVEIMPLLGVQIDDVYVSAEQVRAAREGGDQRG